MRKSSHFIIDKMYCCNGFNVIVMLRQQLLLLFIVLIHLLIIINHTVTANDQTTIEINNNNNNDIIRQEISNNMIDINMNQYYIRHRILNAEDENVHSEDKNIVHSKDENVKHSEDVEEEQQHEAKAIQHLQIELPTGTKKFDVPPVCTTTPMSDWTQTDFNDTQFFMQYDELGDMLDGEGLTLPVSNLTYAVCEFREISWYSHFPHAMQQILRCWSWWETHKHLKPILLWNQNHFSNKFTNAFMVVLERNYNLLIDHSNSSTYYHQSVRPKDTGLYPEDIEITDYAMLSSHHASTLRDLFKQYLRLVGRSIGEMVQIRPNGCTEEKRIPRIVIVNRSTKTGRSILNSNELVKMIEHQYPGYEVEVLYFENIPMYLQMKYMMETDILISPHGAALQNIIFMPNENECSSMIEFFPPLYVVPDFFGSLAKVSNIKHSFFYMKQHSDNEIISGYDAHKYHHLVNYEHREESQCLNLPRVMDALKIIINDWLQCCTNKIIEYNKNND